MYTVLYVDDEPGLLEIGKLFLEQNGQFTVDVITNAPAALSLLQSTTYDAIISDYLMPDMDGIEFLKQVRGSGNTIPFILFTGRGREEIVIQALNEGADFYLQKGGEPVSQFTELAYKVQRAIQRKRAEISIRNHERREQDIINFLPDATIAIDKNGIVIAWNRAIEEMTGIPVSQMLGKGNYEYALPFYGERRPILIDLIFAPPEEIKERYSHIVRTGAMLAAETTLPRLGGETKTLWGKASPLYDQKGEIVGAIESIRDITERRRAEEALRESEEKYRAFFSTTRDCVFITSKDGIVVDFNDAAVGAIGYESREDLARVTVNDLYANPEEREVFVRTVCGQGFVKDYPIDLKKKDGSILRTVISAVARKDAEGNLVGFQGIIHDITAQKQIERDLRSAQEKLTEAHHLAHIGVWEWSLETNTGICSDELCRIMGWDTAKPAPPLAELARYFTPESWDHLRNAAEKVLATGEPYNLELEVVRPDGSRIWTSVFGGVKRDSQGKIVQMHGIVQDITGRKMMEDAIREANRKLNLLSGITRHDIQNQLLTLRSYLALSRNQIQDPVVLGYQQKEEKILETIEHQIAFTRDYQNMGIRSATWQNVNASVMRATSQLPMRDVRVQVDRKDFEILADPLFEKVFYNLIDNALRYGGDRMTAIHVSAQESDGGIVLICEDDGAGISPKDKKHLFTKGFGKNTGFGLFLCREILSITGIAIAENGLTGKGARFEMIVPKEKYRFSSR